MKVWELIEQLRALPENATVRANVDCEEEVTEIDWSAHEPNRVYLVGGE